MFKVLLLITMMLFKHKMMIGYEGIEVHLNTKCCCLSSRELYILDT